MSTQYYCKSSGRRNAMKNQSNLNGIDYLEVGSLDQKTLKVYFVHNLPGESNPVPPSPAPPLSVSNVAINGGVRVKNITVLSISASRNVLTVSVNEAGDFSTYELSLVTSATDDSPPAGYDSQLSSVKFSFKAECPSDFDCASEDACPPEVHTEPVINYLAKDYASFRRLMLDRLSVIMPNWSSRNAADLQIALVELLAYIGDYLSYYQDAVGMEAYLGTARNRISVRRHARLLDYQMHDGCNARAWVCLEVDEGADADGYSLPTGTMLLTRGPHGDAVVPTDELEDVLKEQPVVFETMHQLTLHGSHHAISFYTWSDSECCLPKGSTAATLLDDPPLSLAAGDVLIFEEILSPTTGTQSDADPSRRHAVRLKNVTARTDALTGTQIVDIEWFEEDALPFSLCLTALVSNADGIPEVKEVSIARGNVVLVDHGRTLSDEALEPEEVPESGRYRPVLLNSNVTFGVGYDDETARAEAAASSMEQNPREALPHVSLIGDGESWIPKRDLLASDRFAAEFVVEVENDGTAQLRFGDEIYGKKPAAGITFTATYRIGNGSEGNVGAEAIGRIVTDVKGVSTLRNPLPAVGGVEGETIKEVRQFAPEAFRTQERAVTEADYAEVAERHSEVDQAAGRFRWTGSWYTVFAAIDREKGLSVREDPDFKQEMKDHLEKYRIAGYDIKIDGPRFVPLDISLLVCVKSGYFQGNVKESLVEVFSAQQYDDGTTGFFHPDNFSFGDSVYLSQIYGAAMAVDGVDSVSAIRFHRWGMEPATEKEDGYIKPSDLEIIRLDNDPNYPENGRIEFVMHGGS